MKKPKRILLVEDNKHDQFFFIEALKEIEDSILYAVANNGKEALDKLEEAETLPDLIFMDIHMPVMNGIECLSEIVKNPQTKDIPVVIFSSATDQIDLVRELGAKAFIEKPGDYITLRGHLKQITNQDLMNNNSSGNKKFQTVLSSFGGENMN